MNVDFETEQGVGPFEDTTLPIGYLDDVTGEIVREYTLKDLTGLEIRKIRDFVLARRRPYTWLARAVALSLESLGGREVEVSPKGIPPIIKRLTIRDAEYLIVAAHVHNYGPLTDFRFVCIECEAKENKLTYDLSRLEVTRAPDEFDPTQPVRIELQRGINLNGIGGKGSEDKFNYYLTRIPTVDDLVGVEPLYRKQKSEGTREFSTALLATCAISIGLAEKDGTSGEVVELDSLDLNPKLAEIILNKVAALDWRSINGYVDALPGINRVMRVVCPECGAEVDQGVDPTSLFLVGS